MYDKNNIFAKIIRGELPTNKIYENEYALSFHSLGQAAEVHALVIPKGEYKNIYDFSTNASDAEKIGFWDAFAKTAEITGATDNFNANSNAGNAPFFAQTIMHFHMHLLGGKPIKGFAGL